MKNLHNGAKLGLGLICVILLLTGVGVQMAANSTLAEKAHVAIDIDGEKRTLINEVNNELDDSVRSMDEMLSSQDARAQQTARARHERAVAAADQRNKEIVPMIRTPHGRELYGVFWERLTAYRALETSVIARLDAGVSREELLPLVHDKLIPAMTSTKAAYQEFYVYNAGNQTKAEEDVVQGVVRFRSVAIELGLCVMFIAVLMGSIFWSKQPTVAPPP